MPALAAGAHEIHAMVIDRKAGVFLRDTSRLGERSLEPGGGRDVKDLSARPADEVMMVA
jgi:hypothetical protein